MEMQTLDPADSLAAGPAAPDALRVLRADGTPDPAVDPGLSPGRVAELHLSMLRLRTLGDGLLARSDELPFWPDARGSEAAFVGAVGALSEADWLFGGPAEWPLAFVRGMDAAEVWSEALGARGSRQKGRAGLGQLSSRRLRVASSSPLGGSQLPQAVGLAWAAAQEGDRAIGAAFFAESEIDAADFHNGLNFAAVWRAPTVFIARVGAARSAAGHAVAYGLSSSRCDGSDLLAVYQSVREAAERARAGEGPTLVDLVLDGDQAIDRTRAYLTGLDALDRADEERAQAEVREALARATEQESERVSALSLFEDVYHASPSHLEAQAEALRTVDSVD